MPKTTAKARFVFDKDNSRYMCMGSWSVLNLNDLLADFNKTLSPKAKNLTISGAHLTKFDSAGALTLRQCIHVLEKQKNKIKLIDFNNHQQDLLQLIETKHEAVDYSPRPLKKKNLLYQIGKETFAKLSEVSGFLALLGDLCDKFVAAFQEWRRFQFPSIVANIDASGIKALPIVGLLSFLIGVVLAYQLGIQLETYGANTFIAYLSGMAIFREFAPLITAIIVAGRTSSAYTAQIGSMKINEEIDALYTMGLSPVELIVVPKVLGLLLVFPLLIFWADIFGTIGAMIMSKFMLNVGYYEFLTRLQDSVGCKQLMLGLYKAPAFALLIALVGCFQGFRVQANADSVGSQTTKSVVQALFLIIIADAVYSVVYSWMDL